MDTYHLVMRAGGQRGNYSSWICSSGPGFD